jgi:hypothetical protein
MSMPHSCVTSRFSGFIRREDDGLPDSGHGRPPEELVEKARAHTHVRRHRRPHLAQRRQPPGFLKGGGHRSRRVGRAYEQLGERIIDQRLFAMGFDGPGGRDLERGLGRFAERSSA